MIAVLEFLGGLAVIGLLIFGALWLYEHVSIRTTPPNQKKDDHHE